MKSLTIDKTNQHDALCPQFQTPTEMDSIHMFCLHSAANGALLSSVSMEDLPGEMGRRTDIHVKDMASFIQEKQPLRHGLWVFHTTFSFEEDFDEHLQ